MLHTQLLGITPFFASGIKEEAKKLDQSIRNKNIIEIKEAEKDLIFSIVRAKPYRSQAENGDDLLKFLISLHSVLQEEFENLEEDNEILLGLIRRLKLQLAARISSERIDVDTLQGVGKKAPKLDTLLSELKELTGKIFEVVEQENGLLEIGLDASGSLVSWSETMGIQNLTPNQQQQLNAILTCAHVLEADRKKFFYFVRTQDLDPNTGFPTNIQSKTELINFLKSSELSFEISGYTVKNSANKNPTFHQHNLTMAKPRFMANEDIAIGHIKLSEKQKYPVYIGNRVVNYTVQLPEENVPIFALGYGTGAYYPNSDFLNMPAYNLISNGATATPLMITRRSRSALKTFHDGRWSYTPPTTKGMSGGPLYYYSNFENTLYFINIIGVVSSGTVTNDMGVPIKKISKF